MDDRRPGGTVPAEGIGAPELYRWQLDALVSWERCGRRGIVEAVTGSGKTDVAIAAIVDARRRGRFVLVLVPSRVLMEQWYGRLVAALPDARIGRLGDSGRDQPASCDVLVATRHSASTHRPAPPGDGGGLLVADECHGLGGGVLRRALVPSYTERLGLTATLERSDDAVTDLLIPYFGGICHRYGFEEAIADGVCTPPRVAFVGVHLSQEERKEYVATEQRLVDARHHLRSIPHMPVTPFGDFIAAVAHLAERDSGADGRAARDYLDVFSARRQIVAQSSAKYELLGHMAPAIRDADGALLFTETVRGANHAINRLDPLVDIELITGSTARRERKEILGDLRGRRLHAVAAPRVLDEGIDVPDADLGIVMSASRTRRQMIQRMGRILRRKRPGGRARFVIMFARDTLEDPAHRIDRDGFVEEIERIAEQSGVFDGERFAEIDAFLAPPGPDRVPDPERLDHLETALDRAREAVDPTPGGPRPGDVDDEVVRAFADEVGREAADAYLRFARHVTDDGLRTAAARELGAPRPEAAPPPDRYLEVPIAELPEVAKPKAKPKRLSTGASPLAIRPMADGFRLTCTGCGQSSKPVKFRWQVHDETVACRCD